MNNLINTLFCCRYTVEMVMQTVNLTRKQYDEIANLAKEDCNGNFSKAIRIKLGEKPEPREFQIRGMSENV